MRRPVGCRASIAFAACLALGLVGAGSASAASPNASCAGQFVSFVAPGAEPNFGQQYAAPPAKDPEGTVGLPNLGSFVSTVLARNHEDCL
jgi:hypothetical protein